MQRLQIFLSCFSTSFSGTGLSLKLELTNWLDRLTNELRGFTSLSHLPLSAEVPERTTTLAFYIGARDLSSGLHACMASVLPSEPAL